MTQQLERMPAIRGEYLKALKSLARRPRGEIRIPPRALELSGVRADPAQLAAFREICGFPDSPYLPITFPQVLGAPLQMHLLNQPDFPLPLLGLVHLRNLIEQEAPLPADGEYRVNIATPASRQTDKGLEFDVVTTFGDGNRALWRCTATVLFRNRPAGGGGRKPGGAASEDGLNEYLALDLPADLGRRYGRISGDMNPIHLYPWTAKLFGFPRQIAHGMWSLSRSTAHIEPLLGRAPRELTTAFRNPLLLPGRVALKYKNDGGVIDFALLGRASGKTHLSGSLR